MDKLDKFKNFKISFDNGNYIIKGIINNEDQIVIPSKINNVNVTLNEGCFKNIKADEIVIEDGITEIPCNCFFYSKINTVKLPETVKVIKATAFENSSVKNINLENVEKICAGVFQNTNIEEADLKNIKMISEWAFAGCEKLNRVNLSDEIKYLPDDVFLGAGIKVVELKNVKEIGQCAFKNCKNLQEIDGNHLEIINPEAFEDCNKLSFFECPNVTEIRCNAFKDCTKLRWVEFNNDIQINYLAFNCTTIRRLIFNKRLECVMSAFNNVNIDEIKLNGLTELSACAFDGSVINDLIVNDELKIINQSLNNVTINNLEIHGEIIADKSLGDDFNFDNIIINNRSENKYPEWIVNEKTTYKELLNKGFSNVQISQILKAQNNNILISSISPDTPSNIIHSLIDLKGKDEELGNKILKMCEKKLTLDQEIEVNKIITDYNLLVSSIYPNTPSNIIHSLISLKKKNVKLANIILTMCNKELTLEQEIEINKMISNYNYKNDINNENDNIGIQK